MFEVCRRATLTATNTQTIVVCSTQAISADLSHAQQPESINPETWASSQDRFKGTMQSTQ